MVRAREVAVRLGGVQRCNSFTKFFFAALGQISYDDCPAIPPEIVYLPRWCYFNLYSVSAWTRTMILPLAIVNTLRFVRRLPDSQGLTELVVPDADLPPAPPPSAWHRFFFALDRVLKAYGEAAIRPLRPAAGSPFSSSMTMSRW